MLNKKETYTGSKKKQMQEARKAAISTKYFENHEIDFDFYLFKILLLVKACVYLYSFTSTSSRFCLSIKISEKFRGAFRVLANICGALRWCVASVVFHVF